MIPETARVGYMREREEGFTCIALVQLNRLNSHKYGNPKLKTLQKFHWEYEVETMIKLELGNNWSNKFRVYMPIRSSKST